MNPQDLLAARQYIESKAAATAMSRDTARIRELEARLAAAEKVVEAADQAESVMPAHTTSKVLLRSALTAYHAAKGGGK